MKKEAVQGTLKKNGALQSLRGLFALMIFFHHVDWFEAGGDAGVAFFIILSGFVLSLGYGARITEATFDRQRYMRRRLIRVYPLHLACFVAAIILAPGSIAGSGWEAMGLNLVLLQSWVPLQMVFFSGNAVAWCLSDLLFCYAVFPGIIRWLKAHKRGTVAFTTAGMLAAYIVVLIITPAKWRLGIIYINPVMRLFDFLFGIALFLLWKNRGAAILSVSRVKATVLETVAWLLFVCWVILYVRIPEPVSLGCWWWPVSGILILVFAASDAPVGVIGRILSQRWAVKAGELSFSFYMVHQLCIRAVDVLLVHYGIECVDIVRVALCLIVALTATWLVHIIVEEPARKWLSSRYA